MRGRDDLHTYQRAMAAFIRDRPYCALWADMGTGKTVSTLTAVADLQAQFDVGRALVIAPLRVSRSTWPSEIREWSHLAGLRVQCIQGTPAQRVQQIATGRADVYTINRELVPWLVTACRDDATLRAKFGRRWPFDCVIVDEASGFKSRGSQRFRALRRVRAQINRLVELTGTPASNGLLDLWSQIYLLDQGQRLGRTYTRYRDQYFDGDFMGFRYTPREGAADQIHAAISDLVLRVDADEHLDLPPYDERPVYVDLPARVRTQYRELERDFLTRVGDDDVAVPNAAALTGKLLQCASGVLYTDTEGSWTALHDAKLDALADIVAAHPGRPILVAYAYRPDVSRICERFPGAAVLDSDPATVDRWNRGEIPLLVAHPASAGHGLNLQRGGNLVALYGLTWSLELHVQFLARLRRQGQRASRVIVYPILARDTIDETVVERIAAKNTDQRALLAAVRRDIRRHLHP